MFYSYANLNHIIAIDRAGGYTNTNFEDETNKDIVVNTFN